MKNQESLDPLSRFEEEKRILTVARGKITLLIGLVLFPLFGILDYFIFPQFLNIFLLLRLVTSVVLGMCLWLAYTAWGVRKPKLVGTIGFLIIGFAISAMVKISGGHTSPYYVGLITVIIALALLIPWGIRESLLICSLLYLSYFVPIVATEEIVNVALFINNNFFLLCTIVIALTATYFMDRLRLEEFTSRFQLQQAKEDIEGTNKMLASANVDLEEANAHLKELDTLKSQFFANISHELRTPLTLILAPLESMLSGKTGEVGGLTSDQSLHCNMMYNNGLRLLKLINNLLDISRIDSGKMALNLHPGNLGQFLQGLIEGVRPLAEKKSLRLTFEQGGELAVILFDEEKLEKIVLNIVFNAIKFTPSGGSVRVKLDRKGEEAWIRVEDTGIGIAHDQIPRVFDRFAQADPSSTRKYGGTGIGLALARELVELHGGRIHLGSEVGKGTLVEFSLPLRRFEASSTAHLSSGKETEEEWSRQLYTKAERSGYELLESSWTDGAVRAASQGSTAEFSHKGKILVVEDNPDMGRFIEYELQEQYQVIHARNGSQGLERASQELPNLIISDVMMPEMDGYELTRRIKSDLKTKHIPVILVTAKADLTAKIEGLELGADDYLVKPFNAKELRARVQNLLNLRSLQTEVQLRSEELERILNKLKETQSELVHAEKMAALGRLVAGIAHEINNPLGYAFLSFANVESHIQEMQKMPDELKEALVSLKEGLHRTRDIVASLRTFAHKDRDKYVYADLRQCIDSTLSLLNHETKNRITIHKEYGERTEIECLPGQINQVFMNILHNAISAISNQGDIWIKTQNTGDQVQISIKDNGVGISSEVKGKIFEPFFTTKDVGKGTGLGLSISYRIVQSHGGSIRVESEPGKGAEFIIELPVRQPLDAKVV